MRIWNISIVMQILKISGIFYKSPVNLSYWWNFGSIAFFFLISQMVTGIFLAMFYIPSTTLVWITMIHLSADVYFGWFIRGMHANGASFFSIAVYLHMARSIYYGSYTHPRQLLWVSGTLIWVLMIATAFLGHILPWGQWVFEGQWLLQVY